MKKYTSISKFFSADRLLKFKVFPTENEIVIIRKMPLLHCSKHQGFLVPSASVVL